MSRQTRVPSLGWGLLLAVIGLLLGTYLGTRFAPHSALLTQRIAFGPASVHLGALGLTVHVRTNLVGLVGAAVGALVGLARR